MITSTMSSIDTVVETKHGSIKVVKYNKPERKNAIDKMMYITITNILNEAANDESVTVMVLTGEGDYYSSGNDLKAALENQGREELLRSIQEYVNAFIRFPKLLVSIVNGPAIGIAATTLPLFDLVFANDNSFFYTPFTKLGMVAEACSSYTFPRLMGVRKATEMLMFNHKMTVEEALEYGLINYIYKEDELQTKVWEKIMEVSKLPKHSITMTKKLFRETVQDKLLETNAREIEQLNAIYTKSKL